MEINRIILVTKFKASSERAITRALMLAREHNAHFEILNVIDIPSSNGKSVDDQVKALDNSLKELMSHEKAMRQIIKKAGKHRWTPEAHITMENPNKTRERLLSITDKDFLVVGFGDWSGQLDLSPYISPKTKVDPPACPVWLTPLKARKNLRKQMLFVADDLPHEDQFKNLKRVCEVALKKKMSLDVLATTPEILSFWEKWMKKLAIEGYTIELFADPEKMISEIQSRKPGVLGTLIQSDISVEALKRMDSFSREDLVVI